VELGSVTLLDENRWDEKAGLRAGCGVRSQVIDVLKAQIKRRPAMKKVSIFVSQQLRPIMASCSDLPHAGQGGTEKGSSKTATLLRRLLRRVVKTEDGLQSPR
jgi:hypothetical protein